MYKIKNHTHMPVDLRDADNNLVCTIAPYSAVDYTGTITKPIHHLKTLGVISISTAEAPIPENKPQLSAKEIFDNMVKSMAEAKAQSKSTKKTN